MRHLRELAAVVALNSVGAVLSHAAVAAVMAILWVNPMALGRGAAGNVELMLVLEFVILHSTAFLVGFRFMKGFPRWVFIVVYAPFGLLIASSMASYVVALTFLWHLGSGVWSDFDTSERNIGAFLVRYLPTFFWFVLLPPAILLLDLPALGWAEYPGLAFRWDNGFRSAALLPAWSTLYFSGRAVWELAVRRWEANGSLERFILAVQKT